MLSRFSSISILLVLSVIAGCSSTKHGQKSSQENSGKVQSTDMADSKKMIPSDYKRGQIEAACKAAIQETQAVFEEIAKIPKAKRTVETTLLRIEDQFVVLLDKTQPLTFMGYVHEEKAIRDEAAKCEDEIKQFFVGVFTRKDIYEAIRGIKTRSKEEARLYKETIRGFEKNGLKLSEAKLNKVRELKKKLSTIETEFSKNLNNENSTVLFTAQELAGVSEDFIKRLKKSSDGKYIVTTKFTDYTQVMENASNPMTREKMMSTYEDRGGETNLKLMEEAVQIRKEIAKMVGFANWADYKIDGQMAKNGTKAMAFLKDLRVKLKPRLQADLKQLLKFMKSKDPTKKSLDAWDIRYAEYQIKKADYSLDDDKIREYFPKDRVMDGMFQVYKAILGVDYQEVKGADVWADGVKLYAVKDIGTKQILSYFYTDFEPRDGKYGHAAAFPLIAGRRLPSGQYSKPIASIVANFNPPSGGKPSLLNHKEVETLFHEFGHIMHMVLTRAPYASLSGASVAQDFVEAPSQMLENWVWDPLILGEISGHYSTGKKLPSELIQKMLEARDFNQGYNYTRQLIFGLADMNIHTASKPTNVQAIYDKVYRDLVGFDPVKGSKFLAGFGHLMGGYDAGYYGYLWSEVYAQDMFTKFEKAGLLSPVVGKKYREVILEKGNMVEALDLVKEFLGRSPSSTAFYKQLGIKAR